MSTLGALPILKIHDLRVPPAGGWWCDLELDGPTLPAVGSLLTLQIADLALPGTVTQSGTDDNPAGARPRVTIEGGAGWQAPLTRQGAYSSPGGVRLSTVLKDLAALAGELYDAPAVDVLLPVGYGWPASTPCEPVTGATVLADLMGRGAIPTWRVAPFVAGSATLTGHTRFDAWPTTGAADALCRVTGRNLNAGWRRVGLDARVAGLLPGATLEGAVVKRLHITETASKLEAEVYGEPPAALEALRAIVAGLFPWAKGFKLSTLSGGLRILASAVKLHLAGDAGDPAALRSSDTGGRLVLDPGVPGSLAPALYYEAPGATALTPVAMLTPGSTAGGTVPTLPSSTPATAIALGPGSQKVTIA